MIIFVYNKKINKMVNQNQSKIAKTTSFKRFAYLLGTIFFGIISYTTISGDIQNHIHFSGILNEIGFFVMVSMLSVLMAILTCIE
jgi:hypothetical protein